MPIVMFLRTPRACLLALAACLFARSHAGAQATPEAHSAETEVWPSAVATASVGIVDVGAALRMKLSAPGIDWRERALGVNAAVVTHGVRVGVAAEWLRHWSGEPGEASTPEQRYTVEIAHDLARTERFRLAERPRVEARDFGNHQALRVGDRVQLELRRPRGARVIPYVALESSWDSRWHTMNRVFGYAGARLPAGPNVGVDVQTFGLHDTRSDSRWTRGVAMALRVTAGQ